MQTFLKICSLVSIIIAAIKLALIGNLSPQTAAIIIMSAILILAGGKKIFLIVATALSLYLFVKVYGAGNPQQSAIILQGILTLIIICIGFWIMFKGFFNKKRSR